jgi:hypothetical protein
MVKQEQKMANSDFNLEKLTTKDLSDHIRTTIQMEGNAAIFGRRGVGKTAISKQEISKSGCQEVYINLSVMERVDLGGYPNIMGMTDAEKRRRFVDFLLPKMYQPMVEGNRKVVALLDEVDKADPSLWAPLLEFTQFRSINGTLLPNLIACIMTGNIISEGGFRPSLPLLDRAEKYLVEADVISWLDWGGKTGLIHPSVAAFIIDNPNDLFGAVDPEDRYADPSPRGWIRASYILFQGEKLGWGHDLLHKKVCGCVGKDAGLRYANYFNYYQLLLPMIDKIYQGKDVSAEYQALDPSKALIASMMACGRLATQIDQATKEDNRAGAMDLLEKMGNFLQHVSHENVLAAVRSQVTLDRMVKYDLTTNPHWRDILAAINKSSRSMT